jgi:protein-S-isoprenylcysteine O-methyltransferase Ste14
MARGEGRGGEWVVAQFVVLGLGLVAPRRGRRWPRRLGWVARPLGGVALATGVWMATRAFTDLGASLTPFPQPKEDSTLVREGIYGEVRHPIYGGLILVATGWALLTTNTVRLALAGSLAVLLRAKARREEVWLDARYPDYGAYRHDVPAFFPSAW